MYGSKLTSRTDRLSDLLCGLQTNFKLLARAESRYVLVSRNFFLRLLTTNNSKSNDAVTCTTFDYVQVALFFRSHVLFFPGIID